jgi:hypothetical protein
MGARPSTRRFADRRRHANRGSGYRGRRSHESSYRKPRLKSPSVSRAGAVGLRANGRPPPHRHSSQAPRPGSVTKCKHDAARRGHADVIGSSENWGGLAPRIGARVEDVMARPGDFSLRISTDHMHTVAFCGRPRHFAAPDRQQRSCSPAPCRISRRCGRVGEPLRECVRRQLGNVGIFFRFAYSPPR